MRPQTFQEYIVGLVKDTPGVQRAQTLGEAGETRQPYGLACVVDGRDVKWQILGQLADGEKHDTPAAPVEGQPAAYTAADSGSSPDAWLAGLIGASESPQIAKLGVWSATPGSRDDHIGVTVYFHNGQRVFVRKS